MKLFWLQDNALSFGADVTPLPVRDIETAGALLDTIVICPVTAPALVGVN